MHKKQQNFIRNPYFRYLTYLLLLLPVFIFRDFTPPNELKYVSIIEEAFTNHTWFTFYNHGEIYADKPPLFFWLMLLTRQLTGGYPMWILGLFSLLPAIGILIILDRWMQMSESKHNPVVSNILLLTSIMFTGAALVIRMDMLMTFFIVFSLYTFFRIYQNKHNKIEKTLFPVYIFLALFSKGPIGVMVPVISIGTFLLVKKEIRTFGRYLGWKQWGILLGLCTIWFGGIYFEGGNEYLNNILFKQTVGRGINSFHHKEAMWYYLPRILWTFAPWSLLYITVTWQGIQQKLFASDTEKFFAAIIISNFTVMSIVSSRLDIYLLPIYPFVAYLCSILFYKNTQTKGIKIAIAIPAAIFALVLPVFLTGKKYIPYPHTGVLLYLGAAILTISGIFTLVLIFKSQLEKAVLYIGYGLLFAVFICSFMIPRYTRYFGFREMAETAKEKALAEEIEDYAYYKFYTASNMNAYLHRPVERIDSVEQLDSLNHLPHKIILFVRKKNVDREPELLEWINSKQAYWNNGRYYWYIIGDER